MANMRRVTKLELKALAAIAYKKDIFAKMNKIWCRVNTIYKTFVWGFSFLETHFNQIGMGNAAYFECNG